MSFSLNLSAARVAQIAVGGAAVYGGYKLGSTMVRETFREDLLGDPIRIREVGEENTIYQPREPQGDKLSNMLGFGGAVVAGIGGVLALSGGGFAATGVKAAVRLGAGAAIFALGMGISTGAIATGMEYENSDFFTNR